MKKLAVSPFSPPNIKPYQRGWRLFSDEKAQDFSDLFISKNKPPDERLNTLSSLETLRGD